MLSVGDQCLPAPAHIDALARLRNLHMLNVWVIIGPDTTRPGALQGDRRRAPELARPAFVAWAPTPFCRCRAFFMGTYFHDVANL